MSCSVGRAYPRGSVLSRLPAMSYAAGCKVQESPSSRTYGQPLTIDAPTMSLRCYSEHCVMCTPGEILTQDSVDPPSTRYVGTTTDLD